MQAIEVECSAFRKNADGSWTLTRKTQVKYRIASIHLEEATFRKNEVRVFGAELTRVLEQKCADQSQSKQ